MDLNKIGKFVIIDDRVFRSESGDDSNMAMSKNDFATAVYEGKEGFDSFDVTPFVALFELIRKLSTAEGRASIRERDAT